MPGESRSTKRDKPRLLELPEAESIVDAFRITWTDPEGLLWTTSLSDCRPMPVANTYVMHVQREGVHAGVYTRVLRRGPDGLSVTHVGMELEPPFRRKGFAKELLATSLKKYPAHAIRRVELHADHDGRLVWARDPVRFRDANEPHRMLTYWTLPGTNEDDFAAAAIARGLDEAAVVALLDRVSRDSDKITPEQLRSSDAGQLLLQGASWHGVVNLLDAAPVDS